MELVANINSLDEDNFMYTIFGNMQSMQGYDNNQAQNFYIIVAESISRAPINNNNQLHCHLSGFRDYIH